MLHRSSPRTGRPRLPGLLLVLLLAGCGGNGDQGTADRSVAALRGVDLVAGTSLERYGLLVVPRAGGTAELRSLADPSDVLWEGRTPLPAATEVHALEGVAVLRTEEGQIFRYTPGRDALEELGRVSAGATWTASGGQGLWTDPEASALLAIFRDGGWRYELSRPIGWAAPLDDGGVVALVGTEEERELWLLRGGEADPEAVGRLAVGPPGLVTAWGRRLVLAGPDGQRVVFVGVPQLTSTGEVPLDGAIRALAASPSSHQLYVATASAPRVAMVNRFTGAVRPLGSLDRPVESLRPALFGGYLLAHDGEAAWGIPLEGGAPTRVELDWRADLPLGLPGDRILGVRGGELRLVPLEGREVEGTELGRTVDGPVDAWWTVLRWRPPRPPVVATRVETGDREPDRAELPEDETAADARADAAGEVEGRGGEERELAEEEQRRSEAEGSARETAADSERAPEREPAAGSAEVEDMEAGFYAIVASSQSLPGVADLASTLSEDGFRVRLQRHRDEAEEVWFRCLVGPYPSREAAEGAADRLRSERGLQAWITEVAPDARADILQ